MPQHRNKKNIHGWLNLNKPAGWTSTRVTNYLKRFLNAKKAGHSGTLDPFATGVLPIAFGEATKTIPYMMQGLKKYRFILKWGEATDSYDLSGK
ncbi:MAG: tRNA pseudouridine(55) synthase TruB, partial [Pseudomonadota bacterium]